MTFVELFIRKLSITSVDLIFVMWVYSFSLIIVESKISLWVVAMLIVSKIILLDIVLLIDIKVDL